VNTRRLLLRTIVTGACRASAKPTFSARPRCGVSGPAATPRISLTSGPPGLKVKISALAGAPAGGAGCDAPRSRRTGARRGSANTTISTLTAAPATAPGVPGAPLVGEPASAGAPPQATTINPSHAQDATAPRLLSFIRATV